MTTSMMGVVVCFALAAASMGAEPFPERYGEPSTWGALGSRAHLHKLESVLADRAAYAIDRPRTDVYVLADPAGDALGAGGSGTPEDPFLCASSNDLRALIYAQGGPDICFRLKGEFRSPGPNGLGLHLTFPGVAVRRWPGETARWMVSAFTRPYGPDGWSAQDLGTSTLYTRHEPQPVYWIKVGVTDGDVDRYPCRKASSVADVLGPIGTELSEWYHDAATQTLYVNLPNALVAQGSVSIETAEPMKHAVHVPGQPRSGIQTSNYDGILIDGGLIEGFGFDSINNGHWPIALDCRATNLQHVHDTKARFGWYHTVGGLSASGGIRVYTNVEIGYCRPAPANIGGAGNFTNFVDYANGGGHEVYIDGMSILNGTLPDGDYATFRRGNPIYYHTGNWQTPGVICIRRNVKIRDTPLSGFASVPQFADLPGPGAGASARRAPGSYRSFVIGEDVRLTDIPSSGALSFAQSRGVYYNSRWSISMRAPGAQIFPVLITGPIRGYFLNCDLELRAQPGPWSWSYLTLVSYGGVEPPVAHDCDWVHSRWGVRVDAGASNVAGRTISASAGAPWMTNSCGWFSSLFSADLDAATTLGLPAGNPLAGTGSIGSAYSSTPPAGFAPESFQSNAYTLGVPGTLDFQSATEIPESLHRASYPAPGTMAEFDAAGASRASLAAPGPLAPAVLGSCCAGGTCSVVVNTECDAPGAYFRPGGSCPPGPSGVCCAPDFNADFAVDATDLFVFLDAWFGYFSGQGGSGADFDRNGAVDATDIFIYLDAWFGGCP